MAIMSIARNKFILKCENKKANR